MKIITKNFLWNEKKSLMKSFDLEEIEEKTDAVFAQISMSVEHHIPHLEQ